MEMQELRYAAAVYRERHFVRAANRAHVSQPTLSQGLKKLERELGAALFERSPRGVRVTPAGEKFIHKILPALAALDGAAEDLIADAGEPTGVVRLGAIPTVGPYVVPRALPLLRKCAPRLTVEIHEVTTSLLLGQLKDGRLDLGLLALPVGERGFTARPFGEEPFRLAVAPDHPLARKKTVSVRDLAEERMLVLQEGHCFRQQSLAFCKMAANDPRVIFEGSSLGSVMRLAAAGEGVTLVPRIAADPGESPGLRFIPFERPEPRRQIGALWRSGAAGTPGQKAVLEALARAWASAVEEGEKKV